MSMPIVATRDIAITVIALGLEGVPHTTRRSNHAG